MRFRFSLAATAALALPMAVHAAPPMAGEDIAVLRSALPACSGGWSEFAETGTAKIGAASLAPRLDLLTHPSSGIDEDAGEDLYQIAKAFLAPATGTPDWMLDGKPSLTCAPRPKQAVALMEYLAGSGPADRRGYSNLFEWLGLAYETGAGGVKDAALARRYYLRMRIHSHMTRGDRWSDGIDTDVLANVERAGMRPYLDALAAMPRGGGEARMLLAEAALPTDPAKARRLLRYMDGFAASRLIALEEQGRIAFVADAEDVAFWAEAARTMGDTKGLTSRLLKGVGRANGGDIPTSSQRPPIALFRPYLDIKQVADVRPVTDPVAMRALVDPQGHILHIEPCHAKPNSYYSHDDFIAERKVVRLYNSADRSRLPRLPAAKAGGRVVYGWVLLPAVRFADAGTGKAEVRFETVAAERCLHSGFAEPRQSVINAPPTYSPRPPG